MSSPWLPSQRVSDPVPSPDNLLPETDDGLGPLTMGEIVRTMNKGFTALSQQFKDLSDQVSETRDYYVRREEWKTRNDIVDRLFDQKDKALGELRDASKNRGAQFLSACAVVISLLVLVVQIVK